MADPFARSGGVNFKDAWKFIFHTGAAADHSIRDKAGSDSTADQVAFFTELANRGAIETSNLTANTYITIANLTGKGLLAGVIGPTSGGADTTTFEITRDGGAAVEYPVLTAAGERASMMSGMINGVSFTTASAVFSSRGDLNAAKTILGDGSASFYVPHWDLIGFFGTPCLEFTSSLLVRVKHSQNITNSTATAYKGAMYRMGLA